MTVFRLTVRVTPGASRARVGGGWVVGDSPAALRVAVSERAVDGAASRAVCAAVASAFDVPARTVRLVSGASSRTKVLEIDPAPTNAGAMLGRLLAADR